MTPNKFCFILRGLPGVGKDIVAGFLDSATAPVILSTDNYFIQEGKYNFDKTKLAEAHKATFELFKKAVNDGTPFIVVNNTNIKQFHYYHYLDYAQRHDYLVSLVTIPHNDVSNKELAERNIHGVDQDTIRRMRQAFEWDLTK
jgi:broad-specificity NMP kinase